MKYTLLVYWLSFKWIFRTNLGDMVFYKGRRYSIANGVRCNSWRLSGLDNGDDGWVRRVDCCKVKSFKNLLGSYRYGLWFYKTNWLDIWKRSGIKSWMKSCNIW